MATRTRRTQESYLEVHRSAIVYDAVCPLANSHEETIDHWIKGGASVIAPTLAGGGSDVESSMRIIGTWYERLQRRKDQLLLVLKGEDMDRAKREGKLGIIFHFQGTTPLGRTTNISVEQNLVMVGVYYRLGVRIIQLTYNVKDHVGDGCEETGNGGLSDFGKELVKEMNRVGMLADLSHTGHRTTMEAMEVSEAPCVFSHSGVYAVFPSNRNLKDDQIKAVAQKGGVIGVTAFPPAVGDRRPQTTMDDFLKHMDYIANLVGTDHIGFGSDYYGAQEPYATLEQAQASYRASIASGRWKPETYYPPPHIYPMGIETPDKLPNLTKALLERGYSKEDVHKILGGNFKRVYSRVWK